MRELKFPRLAYNWLSKAGAFIAIISGLLMLLFLGISLSGSGENPYFGIFLYMVLPPFLLGGLLLIPIGMFRQWRRWKKYGEETFPKWPYIDFNKRSHRNMTVIFFFGTILFLVVSAVGSYEAYHFTESITFCGKICHKVMKPEHMAYQNSPHARVSCVACHVGPGAGWYAKSKLAGAYQVYAVTFDKFPRPIPTPIKNLRPAQETCEQCHWPDKFFGAQQRQFNHYMYDSENSHWPINMLIKTGGGDPKTGQTAGIHWHMNIGVLVEYIARDERRQDIPYVRITDKTTGRVTVYENTEHPLTEEEMKSAVVRKMDCMDCHNRPSHIYNSPDHAIDVAILTGRIDHTIPDIKKIAVESMAKVYETEDTAMAEIASIVTSFYRREMSELYQQRRTTIDEAIKAIQEAFSQNIFPEMKVRWSDYSNNIGHFIYPGCMRCHEGKHQSQDGLMITRQCRTCHTILSQGSGTREVMATTQDGLDFVHPDENTGEAWKEMGCYECHSGVQP